MGINLAMQRFRRENGRRRQAEGKRYEQEL
jgi:hypothetical protein